MDEEAELLDILLSYDGVIIIFHFSHYFPTGTVFLATVGVS